MIISPVGTPLISGMVRLWNRHDEALPYFLWFNTDTMVASVVNSEGRAERAEIERFEFIADSPERVRLLHNLLPEQLHGKIVFNFAVTKTE